MIRSCLLVNRFVENSRERLNLTPMVDLRLIQLVLEDFQLLRV
jgi:hypothetical protein